MNNDTLLDAFFALASHEMGEAIILLQPLVRQQPYVGLAPRYEGIVNDYQLMVDYMRRGFKDTRREELYQHLRNQLLRLVNDLQMLDITRAQSAFSKAKELSKRLSIEADDVRRALEGFVSETAMLSLEEEEVAKQKAKDIYKRHQQYLSQLFCALLVSPQWSDGYADFMKEMLLSPTIDMLDSLVIVSAMTLSSMNVFDANKWKTTVYVYEHATDERLRQRALIGWVFSLEENAVVFPEIEATIQRLCEQESVCRELLELQMQVFYCLNAEQDRG